MLSDKLVTLFIARATAEREDSPTSITSESVGGEDSTMAIGWSLSAPFRAGGSG